jgi:hypothetical protein
LKNIATFLSARDVRVAVVIRFSCGGRQAERMVKAPSGLCFDHKAKRLATFSPCFNYKYLERREFRENISLFRLTAETSALNPHHGCF